MTATDLRADPKPAAALPPGPRLPGVAQTLLLGFAEPRYIAYCAKRYGPLWTERLAGFGDVVVVKDPALAGEVLTAPTDVLEGGQGRSELGLTLGPSSLILVDGPQHLELRRAVLPPLQGSTLRAHEAAIADAIDAAIAEWEPGGTPRALDLTKRIALDTILTVVLGLTDAAERRSAGKLFADVLDRANSNRVVAAMLLDGRLPTMRAMWGYRRAVAAMDAWIDAELAGRHLGDRMTQTVLGSLRQARTKQGRALTDGEIRDQVVTLLLAGYETTAATLAWALDLLVHHPALLRELEADVRGGSDPRAVDHVLRETMRVRPSVRFAGRAVAAPFTLAGYTLPVGTRIVVLFGETQRDPACFPDPEQFCPRRAFDDAPGWAYLPFGGGVRRCVGAAFSNLEMRLALTALIERFDFSAAGPPASVERRGVFYLPANGVPLRAQPRQAAT